MHSHITGPFFILFGKGKTGREIRRTEGKIPDRRNACGRYRRNRTCSLRTTGRKNDQSCEDEQDETGGGLHS
jgi:hypothetical protein